MEPDSSEGPQLAESVAKHATPMKQILEEVLGACEDGAAAGVEVLVHGDVDGAEQSGVLTHGNATVRGCQIESSASLAPSSK
jgi:hypothetical protein